MLNEWMLSYWNWCHGHEIFGHVIHMYFIPSLIVLALLLIGAGIHWRNQNKLKKKGEEAEQEAAAMKADAAPLERS